MFPLWLAIVYLLFLVWLLIVKTDKHLLPLWLCNYYSLNAIVLWLVNRKIELYITKATSYHLIEKPVIIFKIQMHIRITLELFEKYKCGWQMLFPPNSRCDSNEQPCLKLNEVKTISLTSGAGKTGQPLVKEWN